MGRVVLSRKPGQKVVVNDAITVEVHKIRGNRVVLVFVGPEEVPIYREEVEHLRKGESSEAIEECVDETPEVSTGAC